MEKIQGHAKRSKVLTSYLSSDLGTYIWPIPYTLKQYISAGAISAKLASDLINYIDRYLTTDLDGKILIKANLRISRSGINDKILYLSLDTLIRTLYMYAPTILKRYNKHLTRSILMSFLVQNANGDVDKVIAIGNTSLTCDRKLCRSIRILPVLILFSRKRIKPMNLNINDLLDKISDILNKNGFKEFIDSLGYKNYRYLHSKVLIYNIILVDKKRDYIEINIREGIENLKIRINLRNPKWMLNSFPEKLVNDLETIIINPIKSNAKYAPRGVVIIGPPGVGKSVLADAIVNSIGLRVVDIKPSIYRSMWYGMTEKILDRMLSKVLKISNIAVLIDDAEFLLNRSSSIHEVHISEISLMLKYLQNPSKPVTILTSNMPNLIDPAILRPGRIDIAIVMGYPDREFRKIIAYSILQKMGLNSNMVDSSIIEEIVSKTRWFNPAEIESFIRMALAKGNGSIDRESLQWAKRKINIDPYARESEQRLLRWSISQFSNIVIAYIPDERYI